MSWYTLSMDDMHYIQIMHEKLLGWITKEKHPYFPFDFEDVNEYMVEEDERGYVYAILSFPEPECMRTVLFVFDEQDRIIADCSALDCSAVDFALSETLYDYITLESDWMYLEQYVLREMCFGEEHSNEMKEDYTGRVLLYWNAYVTEAYRNQGIFSNMVEMMKEFSLRYEPDGKTCLYTAFSLDPDIAVYGPDAKEEPYYYSMEKDEPKRLRNREILEHLLFHVERLIEDEPSADGTKVLFAWKKEEILLVEEEALV